MQVSDITLCLTIGKRPDELRQTLDSLLDKITFTHIIAINDFGDSATNEVFYELCPQGKLISLGYNLGHHKAIDELYTHVMTPYVFHCEDDWLFYGDIDFDRIKNLLDSSNDITSVSLRAISDFNFSNDELAKIKYVDTPFGRYADLTALHEQWYGYHFNPHIARLDTYRTLSPFSQYKKERHISRVFRRQGKYMLFVTDDICHHIGWENSVANPPKKTWIQTIKSKLFG